MNKPKHPVLLVVLDGWGHSEDPHFNAIHAARKPHWDRLWAECPHTLISASGLAVGLPDEQMGNSEVGHMHLGAGRRVYQDFTRIGKAIADGDFNRNPIFISAFEQAARSGRAVHLMGLLSPGGVHSHEDHTVALIKLAAHCGVRQLFIHAFLDGRDRPPRSAADSLALIERECAAVGFGRIATLVGRYFAMDRNQSWDRTAKAYELIVNGTAQQVASDAAAALAAAYARGESDEFVTTTAISAQGQIARIEDGDCLILTNFRADRARQLTSAFTQADFSAFARTRVPTLGGFVAMTHYGAQFTVPVAFPTVELRKTFGEVIAAAGYPQLRIAETEKYAHVTFFFNGGEETPFAGEDRILIPSPAVATYDEQPEMSAAALTDQLLAAIDAQRYAAIICNYANADMVGHTGNLAATVSCIETLDTCLGRVAEACRRHGVDLLVTSDHGNAEKMREFTPLHPSGEPHTAHTCNVVPLLWCGQAGTLAEGGCLSDIAPTLLALMGLTQPAEMTGHSLVALAAPH